MAWSSLLPKQLVTEGDAAQSGFTLNAGQSHGSGDKCMTKSEALARYNLSASAMGSYANNQLVPREAWASGVVGFPYVVRDQSVGPGIGQGAVACSIPVGPEITLYSASSTITLTTTFYLDQGLTDPFNGAFQWYFFPNQNLAVLISRDTIGQVLEIYDCSSIPTTYLCNISSEWPDSSTVCSQFPQMSVYLTAQTPGSITVGDMCYYDSNGINPFLGDETQYYKVINGSSQSWRVIINSEGLITWQLSCAFGL
jgi:hypothetical protein